MSEEKNLKPIKELKEELEKVNGGTSLLLRTSLIYHCNNCGYGWIQDNTWFSEKALDTRCRRCHCSHDPLTGEDCIEARTFRRGETAQGLPVYSGDKLIEEGK